MRVTIEIHFRSLAGERPTGPVEIEVQQYDFNQLREHWEALDRGEPKSRIFALPANAPGRTGAECHLILRLELIAYIVVKG